MKLCTSIPKPIVQNKNKKINKRTQQRRMWSLQLCLKCLIKASPCHVMSLHHCTFPFDNKQLIFGARSTYSLTVEWMQLKRIYKISFICSNVVCTCGLWIHNHLLQSCEQSFRRMSTVSRYVVASTRITIKQWQTRREWRRSIDNKEPWRGGIIWDSVV